MHLCAQRGPEMSTEVQAVRNSVMIFNPLSRKDEENNITQGDTLKIHLRNRSWAPRSAHHDPKCHQTPLQGPQRHTPYNLSQS